MDLDDRTVHRDGFDRDTEDLHLLQLGQDAVAHPALRPLVPARIDRVPVPELPGQPAPVAPLLSDGQDRVEDLQIVERDIAALGRQAAPDVTSLSLCEFHGRSIAETEAVVLTGPSGTITRMQIRRYAPWP